MIYIVVVCAFSRFNTKAVYAKLDPRPLATNVFIRFIAPGHKEYILPNTMEYPDEPNKIQLAS